MNVKILCACGSKYSFDLDQPVILPAASVACPKCGADGTDAANEIIRETMAAEAVTPGAPAVPDSPPPTPPPPSSSPSTLQAPARRPGLPSARTGTGTGAGAGAGAAAPAKPSTKRAYGEPNLMMGTVGAVVGAFVGMMIWYFLIKATNTEIGWVAWGVGGLTGFLCRVLGAGYSRTLGIVAAACAFVAILGGEYLATQDAFDTFLAEELEGSYEQHLAFAQQAVKLETDDQIRQFLATQAEEDGLPIPAGTFTAEDVRSFREEALPELRDLANGRPPKAEYEEKLRKTISDAFQGEVFKASFSLWTILWLILGVGSAWRLGTGETQ